MYTADGKMTDKRDSNHILSNLFLKRDNDLNWDEFTSVKCYERRGTFYCIFLFPISCTTPTQNNKCK